MDSNIDPSIAEQELFHVAELPEVGLDKHHHDHHDHQDVQQREELPNVFRLNEYVAEHLAHVDDVLANVDRSETNSTAAAALNMIQYGFDLVLPDHHQQAEAGAFGIQNAYDIPAHLPLHSVLPNLSHRSAKSEPVQPRLPADFVTVVPYNPNEKPKRLGRPRKHIAMQHLNVPEDNSVLNVNESMVSKFRFDLLPVEGPGSRGGKLGARRVPRGRVTSSSSKRMNMGLGPVEETVARARRTRAAAAPPTTSAPSNVPVSLEETTAGPAAFGEHDLQTVASTRTCAGLSAQLVPVPKTLEQPVFAFENVTVPEPSEQSKSTKSTKSTKMTKITEDFAIAPFKPILGAELQNLSAGTKRKALAKLSSNPQSKSKRYKPVFDVQPSYTTIVNSKNKLTRLLAGPVMGLNYNLYDDNLIRSDTNKESAKEKIAFGFPVRIAPYAGDIMKITSFLNKYKSVVFGKEVYYIGPVDFEVGLSLTKYTLENREDQFVNYKKTDKQSLYDPNFVSPLMTLLFCKLLKLVLNKKKDISTNSQSAAISELRSLVLYLGLPSEWQDTQGVTETIPVTSVASAENEQGEDEELSSLKTFKQPEALYNPLKDANFEEHGLRALKPIDRLILLRALVEWAISLSQTLRLHMAESSTHQDVDGERSTYYVARSVLKGFKNIEDTAKENEAKLSKRSQAKKSDDEPNGELKYIEPHTDPLAHPLRWRVEEMFLGDIGFNIGRFYLCRMVDAPGGGLASVNKMQNVFTNFRQLRDIPSSFKLYVEDVHQMLVEDFSKFGVEFDDDGNEVKKEPIDRSCTWYEVASNSEELSDFISHLSTKVTLVQPILQKQTNQLFKFLSSMIQLLSYQETVMLPVAVVEGGERLKTTRSIRQTKINYSDRDNALASEFDEERAGQDEEDEYVDLDEVDEPEDNDIDDDDDDDYYLE